MRLSQRGLDFIKSFEGLRLKPYRDSGGLWTVGYGHLIKKNKDGKSYEINLTQDITQKQADDFLLQDLATAESGVREYVKENLNSYQYDALVSFCYNIGVAAFRKSTLVKLWNEKRYTQAVREFEKWDHVDGKVIPGLLRRRLKERDCFLGKFKDGKLIPHPDHEVQDRVQPAQPQELPHDV